MHKPNEKSNAKHGKKNKHRWRLETDTSVMLVAYLTSINDTQIRAFLISTDEREYKAIITSTKHRKRFAEKYKQKAGQITTQINGENKYGKRS